MKKQDIFQELSKYFDNYQISELLQKQTGLSQSQLFLCSELINIDKTWFDKIIEFWEKKYPFEYIINTAEFFWLEFYVDERVLIPRNDTEIMVEQTIATINNLNTNLNYIDIWTGSSCIPISVLKNTNHIHKTFVIDISPDALEVSKININNHNLDIKILQHEWSLLEPLMHKFNADTQLVITANLPYIKDNDFNNMDKQTVQYEPDLALYWWTETGFELYEELINQAIKIKSEKNISKIILFIEIWFDQEKYSQNYLDSLWLKYQQHKDNNEIIRCIEINI